MPNEALCRNPLEEPFINHWLLCAKQNLHSTLPFHVFSLNAYTDNRSVRQAYCEIIRVITSALQMMILCSSLQTCNLLIIIIDTQLAVCV